jgi:polysaccharide pyruvyl transferase WcaK-like protein
MERRSFLKNTSVLSMGLLSSSFINNILGASGKKNPVIMIVSGWQDVNIGDIAHTPGLLALLQKELPSIRLMLWKKSESQKVDEMLMKNFPDVKIIHGSFDKDLTPLGDELKAAMSGTDLLIHGSGPSVVAADWLRCWYKQTGKKFGIFGVTIQTIDENLKDLLQKASFIFTRETASIEVLRKSGLSGSNIAFAPDATFKLTIHDEKKASAFLANNKLEHRKFICAVPRLRVTPYYKFTGRTGWSDERIKKAEDTNSKFKEIDGSKLREAMITWVRKTGNKVLVCPEMTYQVDIMDELLIDPLPADVKPFVIKRGYWFPDEAASVYAHAHTVLSMECHSPIIAAANGTPAFYLRQPTDTIKGQMYYDLGFNDWVFEIDNTTGKQVSDRLMEIVNDYPLALKNLTQSMKLVDKRYNEVFSEMKQVCKPLVF